MEIAIIITVFLTSLIQAQFGVGLLAFGTPILLTLGFDYITALETLIPCSIMLSAMQVVEGRKELPKERISQFLVLLPATAIGFVIWFFIREHISMKPMVGTVMILSAISMNIPQIRGRLQAFLSRFPGTSLLGIGLIHGLTNMGGSFLTFLSSTQFNSKHQIRAYVAAGYLLMAMVQFAVAYLMNPGGFHPRLEMLIFAFVGYQFVGRILFSKIDNRRYKSAIQVGVVVLGIIALL